MMTILQERILATTFSTEAAYARLGLCRQALEAVVYSNEQDRKVERYLEALAVAATTSEHTHAVREWGTDWLTELSLENFQHTIEEVYTWLESLPTFTLYVPVALHDEGESVLGHWCREHIDPSVLLDLEVDPEVVGGCAFISNGSYVKLALAERGEALPTVIANATKSYV